MVVAASDWYISIQLCSSKEGSSKVCCGSDHTCRGEAGVYDLPVFTAISKPPGLARATSLGSSFTSPVSVTSTAQIPTQTGTGAVAVGVDGKISKVHIGLGAGLGVLLVIALIATGFLIFRARQQQNIEPKDDCKEADVSSQPHPPMAQLGIGQMEDDFSSQDQPPSQQSRITELPGRGRDVLSRNV